MRWSCTHPSLTIFFEEKDGILQHIEVCLPLLHHTNDTHPFCQIFLDYLEGKDVLWPPYNPDKLTPFQKKVFAHVVRIPRGEVRTYKQIALLIGNPQASRAVARALATNPFPLVIPCHRVVSHTFPHHLGGYTPDPLLKKILLAKEGVSLCE
ncbi:MAG: MGMT family protein [Brevinematales bacterium]|nr:MGMT family protein [Brevinematales bacterium]